MPDEADSPAQRGPHRPEVSAGTVVSDHDQHGVDDDVGGQVRPKTAFRLNSSYRLASLFIGHLVSFDPAVSNVTEHTGHEVRPCSVWRPAWVSAPFSAAAAVWKVMSMGCHRLAKNT